MIALFSDFGIADPYVGQMKAVIYKHAPNCSVIDICHTLPVFSPNASGRLLQMLVKDLPQNSIILAVVDPGVGTDRHALWLEIDGRHFVGPDNGIFARLVNNSKEAFARVIQYNSTAVSASFHGRDVFAPAAAALATGERIDSEHIDKERLVGLDWPEELLEIIYIDHYGNAMTGIRASQLSHNATVKIKDREVHYAHTFADAKENDLFWYENSLGLVELSVKDNHISIILGLKLGDNVSISSN